MCCCNHVETSKLFYTDAVPAECLFNNIHPLFDLFKLETLNPAKRPFSHKSSYDAWLCSLILSCVSVFYRTHFTNKQEKYGSSLPPQISKSLTWKFICKRNRIMMIWLIEFSKICFLIVWRRRFPFRCCCCRLSFKGHHHQSWQQCLSTNQIIDHHQTNLISIVANVVWSVMMMMMMTMSIYWRDINLVSVHKLDKFNRLKF